MKIGVLGSCLKYFGIYLKYLRAYVGVGKACLKVYKSV